MTSTQTGTVRTRTEGAPRRPRSHMTRTGILLALAVAALAVLTVMVGGWQRGADPATPPVPGPSGPPHAYLPGGSVYGQQVPEFGRSALAYQPGGTVYKLQVPHAR